MKVSKSSKDSKKDSRKDSNKGTGKNLKKDFKRDLKKGIKKGIRKDRKDSKNGDEKESKKDSKKDFKERTSKFNGDRPKGSFKPKSKFFKKHHRKGKFSEAKRKKIIEKMRKAEKYKDEDVKKKPFEEPTPEEQHETIRRNYDILLPEQAGYLIPDKNESTYQISQREIVEQVDITSATKHFNLKLNFGPYIVKYYRNGRQTLIAGRRGHVATMDWMTKRLLCEFNAMESIHDVCWLHMPTLFATAQKDWVHIYDDNGTEIHCLKKLYKVIKMEFLPYHFLLVTASDQGFLSWTDTSYGKTIAHFRPKKTKRITSLVQNPGNGIIVSGHSNGVICMWSPNSQEPAAQMLCHPGAIRDVAVAHDGTKMITLGVDRTFKLWDVRKFQVMRSYTLKSIGECVDVSQKDCVSIGMGNVVEIYRDSWNKVIEAPYLRHKWDSFVQNVKFCPFEDVLGIGHQTGFSSILVPGSGEPNFDAFESNPFMTNSQRREMEVKQLLEKVQPELISLDPTILGKVNMDDLKKIREEKLKKYPRPQVKKKGPKPSKLFKFSSLAEYMPSQ